MSIEGKLLLAVILLAVGIVSFFYGDKELPDRTGVVTRVVFPDWGRAYKGKLIGVGLWLAALLLFVEVTRAWL